MLQRNSNKKPKWIIQYSLTHFFYRSELYSRIFTMLAWKRTEDVNKGTNKQPTQYATLYNWVYQFAWYQLDKTDSKLFGWDTWKQSSVSFHMDEIIISIYKMVFVRNIRYGRKNACSLRMTCSCAMGKLGKNPTSKKFQKFDLFSSFVRSMEYCQWIIDWFGTAKHRDMVQQSMSSYRKRDYKWFTSIKHSLLLTVIKEWTFVNVLHNDNHTLPM